MPECELSTLLEDLERAECGSRELDARIECVSLGDDWYVKNQYEDGSGKWLCYSRTSFIDRDKRHPKCKPAPHYTTSIDAALTLVPEGMGAQVGYPVPWHSAGWYASVFDGHGNSWGDYERGEEIVRPLDSYRPNGALALCIAALRARQASETREAGDGC